MLRDGYARECERLLRRVLEIAPGHVRANRDLVYILGVEGRTWEALPYVQRLIQTGQMSGDHLHMALSTEMVALEESEFVDQCVAALPQDPLPLLGRARQDLRNNRREAAEAVLGRILRRDPASVEAQARMGRLLLEVDDESRFLQWHQQLPDNLAAHPEIWVCRGIWASRHEQLPAAVRCFCEAIKLQPYHGQAHYQLSLALSALGERQAAAFHAERANTLSKMDYMLADIDDDLNKYRDIAVSLESLGRRWEAAAWYWAARQTREAPTWADSELQRLLSELRSPMLPARSLQVDLTEFPLPNFQQTAPADDGAPTEVSPFGQPRFANVAAEIGLKYQYYNGADPQAGRAYMFEFQGGGVAVLDYDNDSWPDLYLTQGCRWPVQPGDQTYRDRLFRNVEGRGFVDVTDAAGVGDNAMSSGVTSGDFDNDGWPDLYVCNIGPNRLYHNNGDGTFSDVTPQSATAGDQWSSGAALADFNQDGLPDLYVVSYLAGDVLTRSCEDQGRYVQCGPTLFPAEQDRLYLNLGDGRFQDVTAASGIVAPDGKGLGIVVADFDNDGRLGIFIANDTTANFLFRNRTTAPGAPPRFSEEAMLSGVAFDEDGHGQASMGVAAGEFDDDGRVDLCITNFYRQSNALYVQSGQGLFLNKQRPSGIYDSSFMMLGWGIQFLDAELDGRSDLVLVNGHVNDFRAGGTPYHMRPQFLRKANRDKFVESAAAELGEYFSEPHLGRALARLDWNRDGRDDFVATHIDAPTALLENRTQPHGHYLAIRLIGTAAARDAIGARVVVQAGGRERHGQLTAGDGFQASNDRQLVFGLGEVDRVEEVRVFWPGTAQAAVYRDLPVDQQITIVQGKNEAVARPSEAAP
jgi:tetratricopeptide (TPR) repeat protein